jgi:hypothetical protein
MKERDNYRTMRKATHSYIKKIHVVEIVEHDHFNHSQGGRAHLA